MIAEAPAARGRRPFISPPLELDGTRSVTVVGQQAMWGPKVEAYFCHAGFFGARCRVACLCRFFFPECATCMSNFDAPPRSASPRYPKTSAASTCHFHSFPWSGWISTSINKVRLPLTAFNHNRLTSIFHATTQARPAIRIQQIPG